MKTNSTHIGKRRHKHNWALNAALLLSFFIASPAPASAAADVSAAQCVPAGVSLQRLADSDGANRCPLANAGQDLPALIDQSMPLDASATSEADGQRLEFHWSVLQAPSGSAARPADARSIKTHFVPDLAGDYVFELTVTDETGAESFDTVRYSTADSAPVANVGPDIGATLGDLITFDAVRSYDLDGATLSYHWRVLERPAASRSELSGSSASRAALSVDADGDYVVELVVEDGKYQSAADTLRISTVNSAPVAHAGRTRALAPNSTLILDGGQSSDFDDDALAFHWSVLSAPQGSGVKFDDPGVVSPTLRVDAEGLYLFQLMVDDGVYVSAPSTVLIDVKRERLDDYDIKDYLALTNRGGGDDTDGDGVFDPVDNCVLVANGPQRDTDGDGIGNRCDADLNNDGIVNPTDLGIFRSRFLSTDPDADFNGDGVVNPTDLGILRLFFLMPPGPPGTIIWISLVDGNWGDRLNWDPQLVPSAGTTAIIDVVTDVTVTRSGGSVMVKNLVQNEELVLANTTFEATGAVELGGTITATATTLNNTAIVPSLAGSGTVTLNAGTHTWSGNTLGVDAMLNNGAIVNNSNGLSVDATATIDAPTSPTGFQFLNDQTLSGSGTIVLDGVGNSVISEPRLFPFNSMTLTIAPGLTIRGGKGTIGQANANLIMNADVIADVSGETIRIAGLGWSGTGSLTAQNGGALQLAGNFDNAGGTLSLDTAGGSINLLSGAALRNVTINGAAGTDLTINAGATTLQSVVFNGDMNLLNAAITNVTDGLTINGNVLIDAPSSPTGFQFTNTQTLNGTTTITIDGTGNSVVSEPRLFPFNFTTLTVGADVTVRGGIGTIGQSNASLIFLGDLIADTAGEELVIGGSSWSAANSTIQAINDGEVRFFGAMDNGASAISLDTADGVATLTAGATLANATFNGTSGTNLIVRAGVTNIIAMTFNHDLTHANAAISNVTGGLTINGTSTIVAPTSPTGYQFTESQSLLGTASIVFDSAGNSVISEPRLFPFNFTTLTIAPTVSISGGKATVGNVNATLIMNGSIDANVNLQPIFVTGSGWNGTGTLAAHNGGILQIGGSFDNADQTLNIDTAGGSTVVLAGTALRNATLAGAAGTDLGFNAGTHTFEDLTVNADMTFNNGAIANVTDGLTLNGTALIDAPSSPTGLQFVNTQTLDGAASIVIDGVGNSVISEPRLFPLNFTTLTIASSVAVSGGKGTVGNVNATLVVEGSISADVEQISVLGSTVTNNGLLEALSGQTLLVDNLNTALGDLHAGAGSTISLLDALTLAATSDVFIDIASAASVGSITSSTGTNTYAGTLTVSAVDGFTPNLGDAFDIFSHNGTSGAFATVNSVGLGGGQSFGLTFTPTVVTATVN